MAEEVYGSYEDRQGKDDKRSVDKDYESLPVMSSWSKMNLGNFKKKSEIRREKRSVMERMPVAGEPGELRAEVERMEKYNKAPAFPEKSYIEDYSRVEGEPGEHRVGEFLES